MVLTGWARAAGLRVAVVRASDSGPILREATMRLGGVLAAAGFDVVEVDGGPSADARNVIEGAGNGARVFAAVALRPVAESADIDVWIADSMTQKTSVRRVSLGGRRSAGTSREIALHALDLLRASLLELDAPNARADEAEPIEKTRVRNIPSVRRPSRASVVQR